MTSGQPQLPLEVSPSKPALASVMQFLKNQNLKETEETLRKELGLTTSVSSSHTVTAGGFQSSSIEPSEMNEMYISSVAVPSSAAPSDHRQSAFVVNSTTEEKEEEEEEEDEEEEVDSPRSWPGTLPNRPFPTLNESFLKSITPYSVPNRAHLRATCTPITVPSFTAAPVIPPTLASSAPSPISPPMGMFLRKTTPSFVPTLFTIVPPGLMRPTILAPTTDIAVTSSDTATVPVTTTTPEVLSPVNSIDESRPSHLVSPTKISIDLTKSAAAGKPVVTLASIPPEEMTEAHLDLKAFAEDFKTRRIQLGYTQGAVGQSLAEKGYSNFAQSTISRFEQLQLSPSNAAAIRQVLERWLVEMENPTAVTTTMEPLAPARKRKRRAVYSAQTRQLLEDYFQKNSRPNRALIEMIAQELDLLPEEVRVWFCNKRQKSKHCFHSPTDEVPTVPSPSPSGSSSRRTSPSPSSHTNFSIEELSKSSTSSKTTTTFSPIRFTSHLSMMPPQMSTLTPIVLSPTQDQMGLTFAANTSSPIFPMVNTTV